MLTKKTLLFGMFCFYLMAGWMANALGKPFVDEGMPINPIRSAEVMIDPTNSLDFQRITSSEYLSRFKPANNWGKELNFGFDSSTYWIKLSLTSNHSGMSSWVLEIPYFGLDHVDLYYPNGKLVRTGTMLPVDTRGIFYRYYAFPIELNNEKQDFYLKVQSKQNITVPLRLWTTRDAFDRHVQQENLIQAFYYGGIGILAVFNLLIFLYLRDRSHLFYSVFALLFGLGIFAGNGYGRLHIWVDSPEWDQVSQVVLLSLGTAAALLFTSTFLDTKKNQPIIERMLCVLAGLMILFTSALLLSEQIEIPKTWFFSVFPYLVMPVIGTVLYAGIQACRAHQYSARFFLLAWSVLCLGGLMASLRQLDLIPTNWVTSYALQISSTLEMLLLSFALASRIQHERNLREKAQLDALKSQETLLQTLLDSEKRLEQQVQMRTNDLRNMLKSEKKLREQYIRFGSIISHEFRSPLGIIENQVALLNRQKDMDQHQKRLSIISAATHRLAMLFDRWLQGDRLENHIDTDRPQVIPLDSWLTEIIERCKSYHPNHHLDFIPPKRTPVLIMDEKLLEVVVLNLIDNACKYSPSESAIRISTILEKNRIGISVRDSGIGIDPADHNKIFEEYVQLHPDSKKRGYGLGLSFVKKVVGFYGGEIQVISALGAGAEFIAWFPERSVSQQP